MTEEDTRIKLIDTVLKEQSWENIQEDNIILLLIKASRKYRLGLNL